MYASVTKFWPLLKSAWQLMKAAYWPLFTTFLPFALAGGIDFFVKLHILTLGPGWLWSIVVELAGAWSVVAAVRVLAKKDGALSALIFPWRRFLPFMGTVLHIYFFLIIGLLPLVVPGIVLAFALYFALYVFADEGLAGVRALRRSAQLFRSRGRSVVGRLLALLIIVWGTPLIVPLLIEWFGAMVIQSNTLDDIIQRITSVSSPVPPLTAFSFALFLLSVFILTPLATAFSFKLFRALQALTAPAPALVRWYDHLAFPRYLAAWLIIAVVFPISFVLLNQGDEPFRFGSYLTLKAVKVPDKENAFFPLHKITGWMNVDEPHRDSVVDFAGLNVAKLYTQYMGGVSNLPDNVMINLEARNKEALAALHEVAQYHRLQIPAYWNPRAMGPNSPFYAIGVNLQDLFRFAVLDALYQAKRGNITQALQELNDVVNFGYLLRNQEPGPRLISQFIGVAVDKWAYQGFYKLAQLAPLSKEQLVSIARLVLLRANQTETGARAVQMEMSALNIKSFSDLSEYVPVPKNSTLINYSFKVNKFKNHALLPYAVLFDQMSSCQASPLQKEEDKISAQLLHSNRFPVLIGLLGPGGLSNFLGSIFFVTIGDSPARNACSTQFYGRALATVLALKAYQIDHNGKLPDSPAALVPAYLPSVPKDPYGTGAPIIWDNNGKLLKSVGLSISSHRAGAQPSPDDTPSIGLAQPGTLFAGVVKAAKKYKTARPLPPLPPPTHPSYLPPLATPEAKASRDAKRLKDIMSISRALTKFHSATGVYPISLDLFKFSSYWNGSGPLGALKAKHYLSSIPQDPFSASGWFYGYQSDGSHYTLTARLESMRNRAMCDHGTKDICLYKVTDATQLPNANAPTVSIPSPWAIPPPPPNF